MSVQSTTIDSFELARSQRRVDGEVAVARLPRLSEMLAQTDGKLHYRITGNSDTDDGPAATLHVSCRLYLQCHRCNAPLEFDLDRTARFRFVASEDELNALPIDDDEIDAIVGSRALNVHDWVEDEVILWLPLVPRHDDCAPAADLAGEKGLHSTNPFAVLKAARDKSET